MRKTRFSYGSSRNIPYVESKQKASTGDIPATISASEIKSIRTSRALTQVEFAAKLDVTVRAVQSWEQGKRSPTESTLQKLKLLP
jgi:DNA-binding transcriptional regulator YiaG